MFKADQNTHAAQTERVFLGPDKTASTWSACIAFDKATNGQTDTEQEHGDKYVDVSECK